MPRLLRARGGRAGSLTARSAGRLSAYVALGAGLGALAGIAWWLLVDLPSYRVGSGGAASISERGLTEVIGGDAWFFLLGLLTGIVLGILAWRLFHNLGWPVVLVALLAAVAGALACWVVGYHLGPGDLDSRLAKAKPGDLVPIALTIHARASLLSWPIGAVLPILLASSLGPEH